MVRSMRHWAMAAGVVSEDGRATTAFGRHLFADDGLDPYMEDPATAWLVHWRIAGNATNTTWFWGFSHCPVGTFDRDTLVQALVKFAGTGDGRVRLPPRSGTMCCASFALTFRGPRRVGRTTRTRSNRR